MTAHLIGPMMPIFILFPTEVIKKGIIKSGVSKWIELAAFLCNKVCKKENYSVSSFYGIDFLEF